MPTSIVGTKYLFKMNEQIIKESGTVVSECACERCKSMCKTPCIGTPDDILNLIEAGYSDKLSATLWATGMVLGTHKEPVQIIAPKMNKSTGLCAFNVNGLCELHDKGLKPLEGKLSKCTDKPPAYIKKHHLLLIINSWEKII